jgi:hypothetical protein
MRAWLGLALAAFIAYCFAQPSGGSEGDGPRASRGDGRAHAPRRPPPLPHVHAGDPSVRH